MRHLFWSLIIALIFTLPAHARPSKYAEARAKARVVVRAERNFQRSLKKLSVTDKNKLKRALATTGEDSDSDGVSDIYEDARGSDLCDSDSDDDGVTDDDDSYEDDPDHDNDGHNDGAERKAKGEVVSFADPLLVVGSTTFVIDGNTQFEGLSTDDLTPGTCVEVEGYYNGTANIADKVQAEDDC